MWEEIERSPALAAPGSNNFGGLIASSTTKEDGANDDELQVANDLCEKYKPLVLNLAAKHAGKGIKFDELQAAGQLGLARALRKFDPDRGTTFGAYAKPWISGEITALFKRRPDALASKKPKSAKAPEEYAGPALSINTRIGEDEEGNTRTIADTLIDELAPPVSINASDLTEKERRIVVACAEGETLATIGEAEGISGERVRQLHCQAQRKLNRGNNVALTCIRSLLSRRGYRKPSWAGASHALQEKHFERTKYKGRCLAAEEIAAVLAARPDLLLKPRPEQRYTWKWGKTKRWGGAKSPGESILYRRGKGPWRKFKGPSEGRDRELHGLPAYTDTGLKSDPAWGSPQ